MTQSTNQQTNNQRTTNKQPTNKRIEIKQTYTHLQQTKESSYGLLPEIVLDGPGVCSINRLGEFCCSHFSLFVVLGLSICKSDERGHSPHTAAFHPMMIDLQGECYIAALYFTMATMTTVGYGDIHAGTPPHSSLLA